jgi:hypothetical protein
MKNTLVLFLLTLCATGFAGTVLVPPFGHPFKPTDVDLAWGAPTNGLPRSLWVYRAVRSGIPAPVVSNLMALGSFTTKDRKEVPNYPHTRFYVDRSGKRDLRIDPDWGYIDYRDHDADDMNMAEGVPDERKTFELATNLLPKLGINRALLARKPNNSDLRTRQIEGTATLWRRPGGGRPYATNLCVRGVIFIRCLDGVDCFGPGIRGGCTIEFGSHAKVSAIRADWRKLKRDKLYPVTTPEKMLEWIREGKASYFPGQDWPVGEALSPHKLTITKVTPYYYAEAHGEFHEPNGWVYPFAKLEARFDTGSTNEPTDIFCPILEEKPIGHQ